LLNNFSSEFSNGNITPAFYRFFTYHFLPSTQLEFTNSPYLDYFSTIQGPNLQKLLKSSEINKSNINNYQIEKTF